MELALGSSTFVSASVARTDISHAFLDEDRGVRQRDRRFAVRHRHAIEVDAGSTLFTGGNTYMAYNGVYVTGGGTISPPAGNCSALRTGPRSWKPVRIRRFPSAVDAPSSARTTARSARRSRAMAASRFELRPGVSRWIAISMEPSAFLFNPGIRLSIT